VGEDRTDTHSVGRSGDRLTIAAAAALLGVHKNTVRNRIKNGSYRAELVQTERGPTYLIERDSLLTNLTANTLSSASQEVVSPQAMEFVQELLRPFVSELGEVREELGAERARRLFAEERAAALEAELEALRDERESPESPDPSDTPTEGSISTKTLIVHPEGEEVWLDTEGREAQPQEEATESPETVEEAPDRAEPHSGAARAQEGARSEARPWWRRIVGR
jgi:excisionase family DNA binding protein